MTEYRMPREGDVVRCRLSRGEFLTEDKRYEVLEVFRTPIGAINLKVVTDNGLTVNCSAGCFDPVAIPSVPVTDSGADEYDEIMQAQEIMNV